jgi:hypothetical protein
MNDWRKSWEVWGFPGWVPIFIYVCLIMLMANFRYRVVLCCVVLCEVSLGLWMCRCWVRQNGRPRWRRSSAVSTCDGPKWWMEDEKACTEGPAAGGWTMYDSRWEEYGTWMMKMAKEGRRWHHGTWWRLDMHLHWRRRWRPSSQEGRRRRQPWRRSNTRRYQWVTPSETCTMVCWFDPQTKQ